MLHTLGTACCLLYAHVVLSLLPCETSSIARQSSMTKMPSSLYSVQCLRGNNAVADLNHVNPLNVGHSKGVD